RWPRPEARRRDGSLSGGGEGDEAPGAVKIADGSEKSIAHGTRRRPDPLDTDLLAVQLTQKAAPALRMAPKVLGFRIDYSAERLPVPGAEGLEQHRQRLRLARQ